MTGGNPIGAFPEPDRVRAALRHARRARRGRRDGERAHRARDPRAPGHRSARTRRHLDVRAPLGALRDAVHPGGRRRRSATGARCGGCSASSPARLGRRSASVAPIPTRSPTSSTCAGSSSTHRSTPTRSSPPARAASTSPVEHGWVHETMLPDGRWRLAPAVLLERLAAHREPGPGCVLSPGRDMAWSNSVRYGPGDDDRARLRLHPDDAAEAGVADGDGPPSSASTGRRRHGGRRRAHAAGRRVARARPPRPQPGHADQRPCRRRSAHHDAAHVGSARAAGGRPGLTHDAGKRQ